MQSIPADLILFSSMPDEGYVSISTVKLLYGCSSATVWRHVGKTIPKPRKFGNLTRFNVGELRKALAVNQEA